MLYPIHKCVFIDTPSIIGWGKVVADIGDAISIEIATGLVGDDWAEIDGERFYAKEDDPRCGKIVSIPKGSVHTAEELGVVRGEDPHVAV